MNVIFEIKGIKEALEVADNKIVRQAAADALNRVRASCVTAASKMIRETYNIKKQDIDKTIKGNISRASSGNLITSITSTAKPTPLYYFAPIEKIIHVPIWRRVQGGFTVFSGRRRQVSVKIMKQGQRRVVKHGFVATMKSGHTGIFRRHPTKKMIANPKRAAIIEQRFITVASIFGSQRVVSAVQKVIDERMQKEFDHQLDYRLKKSKGQT